ncbi:MAG: GNAT family N-acetyltransferase [Pseudomonadota bacterium]
MKKLDPESLKIRPMTEQDLDSIVAIDNMYFETDRPDYYREKLAAATRGAGINTSFVAEISGEVVGFIIGALYTGEFGIPEMTANLDTIGVHPRAAGQGCAGKLLAQFIAHMRILGVTTIHTLVDWNDKKLLLFFQRSGFSPSKRLSLQLDLD